MLLTSKFILMQQAQEAAGLGKVRVIDDQAHRGGILALAVGPNAEAAYQAYGDAVNHLAPVDAVLSHQRVKHVLIAAEHPTQCAADIARGIADGDKRQQLERLQCRLFAIVALLKAKVSSLDAHIVHNATDR